MEYIALDALKRYSFVAAESLDGTRRTEARIEHQWGAIRAFLAERAAGSPVAVETVGNWYWIVGEIEEARMMPRLAAKGVFLDGWAEVPYHPHRGSFA